MYLTLPLPEDDLMTIPVILFPINDDTKVLKYSLSVRQSATIGDLLLELARLIYHEELDDNMDDSEQNKCVDKFQEEDDTSSSSYEDIDNDDSSSNDDVEQRILAEKAYNMAVVEAYDCHIRSITPVSSKKFLISAF